MASDSYIQRDPLLLADETGKRLYINILSISRSKGTRTTDLPIPSKSAQLRQLLPLTGQINDFTIVISIRDESANVGNTVSFPSSLSSDSITTIIQQYNYIFDELLSPDINKVYTLYLDWLDKSYKGSLLIEGDANIDDFTGEVILTLNFKEGTNFLAV